MTFLKSGNGRPDKGRLFHAVLCFSGISDKFSAYNDKCGGLRWHILA